MAAQDQLQQQAMSHPETSVAVATPAKVAPEDHTFETGVLACLATIQMQLTSMKEDVEALKLAISHNLPAREHNKQADYRDDLLLWLYNAQGQLPNMPRVTRKDLVTFAEDTSGGELSYLVQHYGLQKDENPWGMLSDLEHYLGVPPGY